MIGIHSRILVLALGLSLFGCEQNQSAAAAGETAQATSKTLAVATGGWQHAQQHKLHLPLRVEWLAADAYAVNRAAEIHVRAMALQSLGAVRVTLRPHPLLRSTTVREVEIGSLGEGSGTQQSAALYPVRAGEYDVVIHVSAEFEGRRIGQSFTHTLRVEGAGIRQHKGDAGLTGEKQSQTGEPSVPQARTYFYQREPNSK